MAFAVTPIAVAVSSDDLFAPIGRYAHVLFFPGYSASLCGIVPVTVKADTFRGVWMFSNSVLRGLL